MSRTRSASERLGLPPPPHAASVSTPHRSRQGVEAPKLEVRQVTIKGNRASAKVHTTASNQQPSDDTVALVREGQDWKIGALSGG